METGTDLTAPSEIAFIKAQAPKAKYVMSVCGGSFILASAGVLAGKRATTNKAFFKVYEVSTYILDSGSVEDRGELILQILGIES